MHAYRKRFAKLLCACSTRIHLLIQLQQLQSGIFLFSYETSSYL